METGAHGFHKLLAASHAVQGYGPFEGIVTIPRHLGVDSIVSCQQMMEHVVNWKRQQELVTQICAQEVCINVRCLLKKIFMHNLLRKKIETVFKMAP